MKRIEESVKLELFINSLRWCYSRSSSSCRKELLRATHSILNPLELNCNINPIKSNTKVDKTKLNVRVEEFRPKRNSVAAAKLKIQEDTINEEHSE